MQIKSLTFGRLTKIAADTAKLIKAESPALAHDDVIPTDVLERVSSRLKPSNPDKGLLETYLARQSSSIRSTSMGAEALLRSGKIANSLQALVSAQTLLHAASAPAAAKSKPVTDIKPVRLKTFAVSAEVKGVAYSPDGIYKAIALQTGEVQLLDTQTNKLLHTFVAGDCGYGVSFSADGKHLLTTGEIATTPQSVANVKKHKKGGAYYPWKAAGMSEPAFILWDIAAKTEVSRFKGHKRTFEFGNNFASLSAESKTLLTNGSDQTLRIWDVSTARELNRISFKDFPPALSGKVEAHDIALSPDGTRAVAVTSDGCLRMWCTSSSKLLLKLSLTSDWDNAVKFTPDGKHLLVASDDFKLRLIEAESGKEVKVLKGHKRTIFAVAISQNGERFASTGLDNSVRIWSNTGKFLRTISAPKVVHGDAVALAFSADGTRLLVGHADAAREYAVAEIP